MKAIFAAAALASVGAALPAHAQTTLAGDSRTAACDLRIEMPSGDWIIDGYDPFGNDSPTGSYDLLFVNSGAQQCQFYPLFQTDGSVLGLVGADGRGRVPYSLIDTYGDYNATPVGGRTIRSATRRAVVIAAHSQQLVRYVLTVADNALPGDGLFSQRLIVEADDVNGAPLADRQVLLGINVLPSATMALAGAFRESHGQADIDLGELSSGIPAVPLSLHVQSTRRYKLQVESLNHGKLRLAGTQWTVPYQLAIADRLIPFGSTATFGDAAQTGLRYDTLPLTFHIGDVSDRRAGTYSDTVTVSISVD